ncbi:hypothetical protein HYU11_00330 [Candidatus Woesearchaeota archaeon]|nr:hypothetical protein [Candidatus Woesearchaeota archaeon]
MASFGIDTIIRRYYPFALGALVFIMSNCSPYKQLTPVSSAVENYTVPPANTVPSETPTPFYSLFAPFLFDGPPSPTSTPEKKLVFSPQFYNGSRHVTPTVTPSITPKPVPPTPTQAPSLCYDMNGKSPSEKSEYLVKLSSPVEFNQKRVGMNHNFRAPTGGFNPLHQGAPNSGWARFVFIVNEGNLDEAFGFYDLYFYDLAIFRIKPLVVFNTQSHISNYWSHLNSKAEWDEYVAGYTDQLGKLLDRYGYAIAGIELGNENDFHSSYIPPERYAALLKSASAKIDDFNSRKSSRILKISGGLVTGSSALEYLMHVRDAIGGDLPVDVIAYHLYGYRIDGYNFKYPEWGWNGSPESVNSILDSFRNAGFREPFMITEAGIQEKNPARQKDRADWYDALARYLFEYRNDVDSLIFFAGSDINEDGFGFVDTACNVYREMWDGYLGLLERY